MFYVSMTNVNNYHQYRPVQITNTYVTNQ